MPTISCGAATRINRNQESNTHEPYAKPLTRELNKTHSSAYRTAARVRLQEDFSPATAHVLPHPCNLTLAPPIPMSTSPPRDPQYAQQAPITKPGTTPHSADSAAWGPWPGQSHVLSTPSPCQTPCPRLPASRPLPLPLPSPAPQDRVLRARTTNLTRSAFA